MRVEATTRADTAGSELSRETDVSSGADARIYKRARFRRRAVAAVLFLLISAYYYAIARRIWGGNSDVATPLLQGQAMAQGHLTLNGWNFIHDSFWTIDVLFYTVGYLVLGVDPHLMFIVPALVAACILLIGVYMARAGLHGSARWAAAGFLVVAIGLPTQGWTFLFLSIYGHPATILYALIAFVALLGPFCWWRWVLAVGVLAMGLLGDLQILPLAVGPILGAAVVGMLRSRTWRSGRHMVAAVVAAPVVAYVVRHVAEVIGTYGIADSNPTATTEQMRANLVALPRYLAWAFGSGTGLSETVGANVSHSGAFGRLILDGELRLVVMVPVVLAVVAAVVRTTYSALAGPRRNLARVARNGQEGSWRLDDMLAIACVGDVVFFAVATLADDPAYTRYIASFVVFGSILAARQAGALFSLRRVLTYRPPVVAVGVVVAMAMSASSASSLWRPEQPFTNSSITDFVASKGLTRGVGMFWDANQSTVASGGAVEIRPVLGTAEGFVPREQLARDTWYRQPFEFVLCADEPAFEGVSCELAEQEFGRPAQRYTIGDRSVLVWPDPVFIGR